MDGVRAVARINGVIGWLTVAIGAVGVLVLLTQFESFFGRGGNTMLGIVFLFVAFLSAITPFSIWAGLTALCEIHERQEDLLDLYEAGSTTQQRQIRSRRVRGTDGRATDILDEREDALVDDPEHAGSCRYSRGDKVTILESTTLYDGEHRPGYILGSIPANTNAQVLSVRKGWIKVKTDHGDVGFVKAPSVTPGSL